MMFSRSIEVFSSDGSGTLHDRGQFFPYSHSNSLPTTLVKPFTGFYGRVFNITTVPVSIVTMTTHNSMVSLENKIFAFNLLILTTVGRWYRKLDFLFVVVFI